MTGQLMQALLYTTVPVGSAIVAGLVAAFWPPSPRVRSHIQHFAAGVVFSAVGVEVLPDLMNHQAPVAVIAGFALGTGLMLLIRWVSRRLGGRRAGKGGGFPWSYVLAIAVDVSIDGLLLGIAFIAGQRTGILLAVALAAEFASLGLATAAELVATGMGRTASIVTTTALGLLPVGGLLLGMVLLRGIGGEGLEAMLAFAAAALLYLVTEELLVEAHEIPETPFGTAMFFVGFLGLLAIPCG